MEKKKCPICGRLFSGVGAISRADNSTEICSKCGLMEAMKNFEKDYARTHEIDK